MSIAPVNLVDSSVLGIQLGLYSQAKQLYGFQSGLYSEVENGNGAQVSFGNNADNIDGAQVALPVTFQKKTNGLQIGIYNNADEVNGGTNWYNKLCTRKSIWVTNRIYKCSRGITWSFTWDFFYFR